MRVCWRFLVLSLRLFALCVAKAVDLDLYRYSAENIPPPAALIECTPSNCSKHLDCSWKYCPKAGYVPKCVEGNYSDTCCTCSDERPIIKSLMISSTCSNIQPLRFRKGYFDNRIIQSNKMCHQLLKHDIQSKSNKLSQLYGKIPHNKYKDIIANQKKFFEIRINTQHRKRRLMNQIRKMYEFLAKSKISNQDASEDTGNFYVYLKNDSVDKGNKVHASNSISKVKKDVRATAKTYAIKSSATESADGEIQHGSDGDKGEEVSDYGGKRNVFISDSDINDISESNEPKVIMGDKLVVWIKH